MRKRLDCVGKKSGARTENTIYSFGNELRYRVSFTVKKSPSVSARGGGGERGILRETRGNSGGTMRWGRNTLARVVLVAVNLLVLAFAALLLYFGAAGLASFEQEDDEVLLANKTYALNGTAAGIVQDHHFTLNPFKTCLFLGAYMFVAAFFGLCGGWKGGGARGRCTFFLFTHIVLSGVGVACLVYGAAFVLLFKGGADDTVATFWVFIKDNLPEDMSQSDAVAWFHAHLSGAAAVLILAAVLLVLCIVCDSQLLGHEVTARRVVILSNAGTTVLGVLLIVAAVEGGIAHIGGAWLPYMAAGVGAFAVVVSLLGICGVWRRPGGRDRSRKCGSRRALCVYAVVLLLLLVLMLTVAVIAFTQVEDVAAFVAAHWSAIEENVVGHGVSESDFGKQLSQHLNLIGIGACILLVTLLFNTAAGVVFWRMSRKAERSRYAERRERRRLVDGDEEAGVGGDDDDEEEEELDLGSSGEDEDEAGVEMSRRAERANV